MSTNNRATYDVRIGEYQRSILASALLTFISEVGFQGRSPKEDLEEAQQLLACLGNEDGLLEQEGINDITPDF